MFDILAMVWALIRGRVLIRTWALIRGNTVSYLMFEERAKPSCKKTAIYLYFFLLTFCKNSFNTVARMQRRIIKVSSTLGPAALLTTITVLYLNFPLF